MDEDAAGLAVLLVVFVPLSVRTYLRTGFTVAGQFATVLY